jgi:signal transduction histidine kinase
MQPLNRFQLFSLRGKLEAASWAGLITTAMLTGLLLLTAWTASGVVRTARLTHQRVRIYTELETAVHKFEATRYQQVRDPSPEVDRAAARWGLRVVALLNEARQLPISTEHDRIVAHRVGLQGRAVLARFKDPVQLVRQVDAKWRESGSRAALKEVNRISAPVFALENTLQNEIRQGDSEVAEATRNAQRLIGIAVAASLIGFLIAVGFSLTVHMLLRMRLRPGLACLERGAQAFASGDLDHRIALPGGDELSRISAAFDTMATTVSEKQNTLREVQLNLARTVELRTEQLQLANGKLSAEDERRRAFLADVSHELRTPLTIIRGETQVALRTADDPSFDATEVFERILQQTRDLSRMVDDLFLIARAEGGGLPLELEMLDLQDVAARVAADFATLAGETGGSIHVTTAEPVFALIDASRVRRAMAALIENAMRHCQPGLNIEIQVRTTRDATIIAVSDDGPGIDPSVAALLFERFRRGDTRGEGSGLGLSLVSALVEAHGGRSYLAKSLAGGTCAVMEFPRATYARAAA